MSRFEAMFARLADEGRSAIMPYITAGDPTLTWTERLVDALVGAGADAIELGVPYSDPLADGPTVQAAGQRALASGTTVEQIFGLVARLHQRHVQTPIALLVYYNCIFRWGEARFVEAAKASGVDALIVPDLPPEEAETLQALTEDAGVDLVYLLAPTSTAPRIERVTKESRGFIYCVSLTGVTGARAQLSDRLASFIGRVREGLARHGRTLPLAVGFGISTPEHVQEVGKLAEGVIVGSALIDTMHSAPSPEEGIARCEAMIHSMRAALPTHASKAGERRS